MDFLWCGAVPASVLVVQSEDARTSCHLVRLRSLLYRTTFQMVYFSRLMVIWHQIVKYNGAVAELPKLCVATNLGVGQML